MVIPSQHSIHRQRVTSCLFALQKMAKEEHLQPLVGIDNVNHVLEVCRFDTDVKIASVHEEGFTTITNFGIRL